MTTTTKKYGNKKARVENTLEDIQARLDALDARNKTLEEENQALKEPKAPKAKKETIEERLARLEEENRQLRAGKTPKAPAKKEERPVYRPQAEKTLPYGEEGKLQVIQEALGKKVRVRFAWLTKCPIKVLEEHKKRGRKGIDISKLERCTIIDQSGKKIPSVWLPHKNQALFQGDLEELKDAL